MSEVPDNGRVECLASDPTDQQLECVKARGAAVEPGLVLPTGNNKNGREESVIDDDESMSSNVVQIAHECDRSER
jgi:hypothetical protein